MDTRNHCGTRKPPGQSTPSNSSGAPLWATSTRPLSDIREITEPSLIEGIHRKPVGEAPKRRWPAPNETFRRDNDGASSRPPSRHRARSPLRYPDNNPDRSSVYSIPLEVVPPRSSSRPASHKRSASIPRAAAVPLTQPSPQRYRARLNQGQSMSPLRGAVDRLESPRSDRANRVPSRTIIKTEGPSLLDILDHPNHFHPRIKTDILVTAPLFVGGSSVEGSIRIVVDEAERVRHRKTITLERVAVDLLGVEEVSGPRRHIFMALGNELIDLTHPPPDALVESQQILTPLKHSWILIPSIAELPFLITLPLEVGPPPFHSQHARIRYVLCATLTICDSGRQLCIRCSQEISILSVYDPEKALVSLPSPLTASEEYISSRGRDPDIITVTAGLHRQVWVSGTSIFADVHISNKSRKTVKKLELQLERFVLRYKHVSVQECDGRSISLPADASIWPLHQHEKCQLARAGTNGWNGVIPGKTVLRTCDLAIPRDHATIKCNKYFEVRYYLKVIVSSSHTKLVVIQLPIVLIHMNSLDVPTNSVAQVAAAIEEKRGCRMSPNPDDSPKLRRAPSRNLQGRAFAAPRMQSLDRARQYRDNLNEVREILEASPRKHSPSKVIRKAASSFNFKTPPSNRKGRIIQDDDANELRKHFGRLRTMGSTVTNRSLATGSQLRKGVQNRASSALGFHSATSKDGVENPPPVPPKGDLSARQTRKQPSFDFWMKSNMHEPRRPIWQSKDKGRGREIVDNNSRLQARLENDTSFLNMM